MLEKPMEVVTNLAEVYHQCKQKNMKDKDIKNQIYGTLIGIQDFYNSMSSIEILKLRHTLMFQFYCKNRCIEFGDHPSLTPGNEFAVEVADELDADLSFEKLDGTVHHYKSYHFVSSPHFVGFRTNKYSYGSLFNIKFYCCIDPNNILSFLSELLQVAQKDDVSFYAKSRFAICNDMVTVRTNDVNDISAIYNVLQKYKIPFASTPFLPLDSNGIGITLDDSSSFNDSLSNLFFQYFESGKNVDPNTFLDYLIHLDMKDQTFICTLNHMLNETPDLLDAMVENLQQLDSNCCKENKIKIKKY